MVFTFMIVVEHRGAPTGPDYGMSAPGGNLPPPQSRGPALTLVLTFIVVLLLLLRHDGAQHANRTSKPWPRYGIRLPVGWKSRSSEEPAVLVVLRCGSDVIPAAAVAGANLGLHLHDRGGAPRCADWTSDYGMSAPGGSLPMPPPPQSRGPALTLDLTFIVVLLSLLRLQIGRAHV